MASCTCGHLELRHPIGPCLDCGEGQCTHFSRIAFVPPKVAAPAVAQEVIDALPSAPPPELRSVKPVLAPAQLPLSGEAQMASRPSNGVPQPAPQALPLDGPDGNDV